MAQASSLVPYQLKVRSKNPKNFKYSFCQQTMSKIRNDFIKQHQRGRWRYLSLLAQSVDARFPAPPHPRVCLISLKKRHYVAVAQS